MNGAESNDKKTETLAHGEGKRFGPCSMFY